MKISELRIGKRVHWNDPDNGVCSGDGTVVSFCEEDAIVLIKKDDGGETEALPEELTEIGTEDDLLGQVRSIVDRIKIDRTDRGKLVVELGKCYTYGNALAKIQDLFADECSKRRLTKNDLIVLLSDNYGDVPGSADVLVRAHDGELRPAYVVEQIEDGRRSLIIGPESEI